MCIEFLEENFERWAIIASMLIYIALLIFFTIAFFRLICLMKSNANEEYVHNFKSLVAQYMFATALILIQLT